MFLSQYDIENYYHGFCNKTIWPLFHYFPQYTVYEEKMWKAYKKVNEIFRDVVLEVMEHDDFIWIHDYHLMLLPRLIREEVPNATIGFFLHIPFPSFDEFCLLPWREEIINGILGADLVGFHTYDYAQHFLDTVRRLLGHEHALGQLIADNRVIRVDVFPMGIDYKSFSRMVEAPEVRKEAEKIKKRIGDRKIILSIDRLDYTKGIPLRLEAFDLFLEKNPKYREKVTLILVAVPSRTRVEPYVLLKKQIDELVGRINGKYGTLDWTPIWYLYRFLPFHVLVALYSVADVALLTPLRDGMNLIAKEFVATKVDGKGVLIISEMAGASKELGEAIVVNPNNRNEVVKALERALEMTIDEQIERNRVMQERLKRYDINRWVNDFIDRLFHVKKLQKELYARKLTAETKKSLISNYRKSRRRLILLDYDGTLVPFAERPEKAKPDNELLKLLNTLTRKMENEVVIVSGRDRVTLENWFGNLNVGLIAENGVWIRERGGVWKMTEPLKNDWKKEVRPILELYVDRTPGSFIEEKEFSLVWHYRKADPRLGIVRVGELKDALLHLIANLNLRILEGDKVIEIKNASVNKGKASLKWIQREKWDFILAIGDDWTDEDLFAVLPKYAYSIKVGFVPSKAKFNLSTVDDVRSLLRELANT